MSYNHFNILRYKKYIIHILFIFFFFLYFHKNQNMNLPHKKFHIKPFFSTYLIFIFDFILRLSEADVFYTICNLILFNIDLNY